MTRLKLCTPHSSNCEKMTNEIINTIRNRLSEYIEEEKYFQLAQNVKDKTTYKKNMILMQINSLKSKLESLNKKIDKLYEDRLNEVINVSDFERMYKQTLDKKAEIEKSIKDFYAQMEETSNEVDLKKLVEKFINMEEVTREMLVSLVDRITISEEKEIKIYYKFNILDESESKNKKILSIASA